MKTLVYETQGTCCKQIALQIDDENTVQEVHFLGGCAGNTSGISSLVRGMKVEEVVARLKGTRCGMKGTSCPDQLARALEEAMK